VQLGFSTHAKWHTHTHTHTVIYTRLMIITQVRGSNRRLNEIAQQTVSQSVTSTTHSFPDEVAAIFHWHNPSDRTTVLGVDSASNRNEYQEYFLEGKGGQCVGLSWNLWASTSWNPQDLSRPVMRLLYLYHVLFGWQNNRGSYGAVLGTWVREELTVYVKGKYRFWILCSYRRIILKWIFWAYELPTQFTRATVQWWVLWVQQYTSAFHTSRLFSWPTERLWRYLLGCDTVCTGIVVSEDPAASN